MGKYPASPLHDWFSDWHYHMCAAWCAMTDHDRILPLHKRLWYEKRGSKYWALDLKLTGQDEVTPTEAALYDYSNIPTIIVEVEFKGEKYKSEPIFTLTIWSTKKIIIFSEIEMIKWIESL